MTRTAEPRNQTVASTRFAFFVPILVTSVTPSQRAPDLGAFELSKALDGAGGPELDRVVGAGAEELVNKRRTFMVVRDRYFPILGRKPIQPRRHPGPRV